jgi:predicted enzyme related to lactoylglutathione lyase
VRPSHVFAGIPTADLASAVAWYEKLLGRRPDRYPHASEAVWQLTETGLIYVVVDPPRAGHGLLTLIVHDLTAELARLKERGMQTGSIEPVGDAARSLPLTDPDGNRVTIAQVLT